MYAYYLRQTAQNHSGYFKSFLSGKQMIPYVDLHCDTLTLPLEQGVAFYQNPKAQINVNRLLQGGCRAQCFALFCAPQESFEQTLFYLNRYQTAKEEIKKRGVSPLLTVDGGGGVNGDLSKLSFLAEQGVKTFGLTWNNENEWGYPCGENGGLKPFGKKGVEFLVERKIYPDISHLSDDGVKDVFEIARTNACPVVATHSLSRTVYRHKRNVTDRQIKRIAESGGVVGVNFVREFLGEAGIVEHIKRIYQAGGEDVLAIGSDFDGTKGPLYRSPKEMQKLFYALKKADFSVRLIEKLAYKNARRLYFV